MQSKKFKKEEIDKLTFHIDSLSQVQRELIRHELKQMLVQTGGILYQDRVHKELLRMQHAGEISEIDRDNLEEVLFG